MVSTEGGQICSRNNLLENIPEGDEGRTLLAIKERSAAQRDIIQKATHLACK